MNDARLRLPLAAAALPLVLFLVLPLAGLLLRASGEDILATFLGPEAAPAVALSVTTTLITVLAAVVCAAAVAPMGVVPRAAGYGLLWFAAGCGSALLWAGLNTVAVEAVPTNRAGAVSVFAAFKFAGTAVAPLIWLPVYDSTPAGAFLCAAASLLAIVPLVLPLRR